MPIDYEKIIREIRSRIDELDRQAQRLDLKPTERAIIRQVNLRNRFRLGAYITNWKRWGIPPEMEEVEEIEEVTEILEEDLEELEEEEEVKEERPMYKSWLLAYETPKGGSFDNRWIDTKVEVKAETVNYYDKLPSDREVEQLLIGAIAQTQWDWIFNMNAKFQYEEPYFVDQEPYDYVRITISRLDNYERVEHWEIPY